MFYVYMLKNPSNDLYIGITRDLKKRTALHNVDQGALFTREKGIFEIVFNEEYKTLTEARKRETQIKKWRRDKKEMLIKMFNQNKETRLE
jgi:putative endonuclease